MKTIEIDDDIYCYLIDNIVDFGDTPNEVLRRLLNIKHESSVQTRNASILTRANSASLKAIGESQGGEATTAFKRKRQAKLSSLVKAGLLKEKQTLYLYINRELACEAKISGDYVAWEGKEWSMSALALEFLKRAGFDYKAARGPAFWFEGTTDNAKSISMLWNEYLERADLS